MERPRLRHVADLAGVSEATVSRVVNERQGVAEGTRRRVQQALTSLGYEPVGLARARRAGLVGVVVPELDNPFFPAFADSLEDRLSALGLTMVLCTAKAAGLHEEEDVQALLDHRPSGIVFLSGRHADTDAAHGTYRELASLGVPMVLVNGRPDDLQEIPAIAADDRHAVRIAVAHLVALGHDRIGLLSGPGRMIPSQRKRLGYSEGLQAAGLSDSDDLVVEATYSIEGGQAGAATLLERGVTAMVCASDSMAVGALRAARDAGLVVPRDLSVVGFDDTLLARTVTPPLTTSRQPIDGMVQEIVAKLGDQIAGRPTNLTEFLFRTDLIVRQSTGAAPA